MTGGSLSREVGLLCAEYDELGHPGAVFVAPRLRDLMAAGHRLTGIEAEFRRRDARFFLLGLPLSPDEQAHYQLFHPDEAVDDTTLRFSLWIGVNGRDEADAVLAEASLTRAENAANLAVTGLLAERAGPSDEPTTKELLSWLLLDAPTWTARRDAIRRHLDLLRDPWIRDRLDEAVEVVPNPDSRRVVRAIRDLVVRATEDGPAAAFATCESLVLEALEAFLAAPTWTAAAEVHRAYPDELGGDLAGEILAGMKRDARYTAAQLAVLDAHGQVLEDAWEHGIEAAATEAQRRYPVKYGTPAAEDHLLAAVSAPDLETARDILLAAPTEVFLAGREAVLDLLRRRAPDDEIWRVGLVADAAERGVEAAYADWAELAETTGIPQLTVLLGRHRGYLRDRALELLLTAQARAGNQAAEREIAQELAERRTPASPPGRRPYDLVNLGVVSSKQGDLDTARAAYREAHQLLAAVSNRALRGLLRLRAGIFAHDYDDDFPTAVHHFRGAVEDFRATDDTVSMAYTLEQLSSVFRDLERGDALMYATVADRLVLEMDVDARGVAGDYGHVAFDVYRGMVESQFLFDDFAGAADRANWMLSDPETQMDDDERIALQRILVACAIREHRWGAARKTVTSWRADGFDDWAGLGHATVAAGRAAARRPGKAVAPARHKDLAGLAETLRGLGAPDEDIHRLLIPTTWEALSDALIDTLAGAKRADPLMGRRVFGDYEAEAWRTRSDRIAPIPLTGGPDLPAGAPWREVIAHYHERDVWQLPDLAVLGPVLDRWSALSRFDDMARINQPAPGAGLDVYFYQSDPESHLASLHGCAYVPESEMIVCSLSYLEGLFNAGQLTWEAEETMIRESLAGSEWEAAATVLTTKVRARQRVLLEWVIAHEIGHAHHGHAAGARTAREALALEEEADAFFLDGIGADDGAGELYLAMSIQLRSLYAYEVRRQRGRTPTDQERQDLSVRIDGSPDETGHRPLVFRAVNLVRSLLRRKPELASIDYYDRFAATLEGR